MLTRTLTTILIASALTGCATPVTPTVSGGSRADGVVVLTGDYGLWKKGEIDWQEALVDARATCNGWGYRDAKAFGRYQWQCTSETPVGCANTRVTLRFQCTGLAGG
jgi:hypothetical protein